MKAEVLTILIGNEFATGYLQTNMIFDIEYYRVVDYSEAYAEVFYVEKNHETGHLINFYRKIVDQEWVMIDWDTIWSKTGSASGFMWPYYR